MKYKSGEINKCSVARYFIDRINFPFTHVDKVLSKLSWSSCGELNVGQKSSEINGGECLEATRQFIDSFLFNRHNLL